VNVGYPVNSTDDDLFFTPVGDGFRGYYAKFEPSGFGKMDLFIYDIFNDRNPRNFYVTGKADINNLRQEFPEKITVTAVNNADASRSVSTVSDPVTGIYALRLPQGSFNFNYAADGAAGLSKMVEMPLTHRGDTVQLEQVTLPNADFVADMHVMTDTTIAVTSGAPMSFNLKVEPRSILKIEAITGDSVYQSASRQMSDTAFTFSFVPPKGDSKVVFSLTDRFGNNTSASVSINRTDVTRISKPQYEKIIARQQIETLLEILKKYADDDVIAILNTIDPEKEKPGTTDDLISLIKERASSAGIAPVVIDKLALEVALKEGIVTQAAVDLMYQKSEGPIHDALAEINVQDLKIRNWNDLVTYIESHTAGAITGADLRTLAEYILMDPEPGIDILRQKVLFASTLADDSVAIRDAVTAVDAKEPKFQGEWLNMLLQESANKGIAETINRISTAISHKPGTNAPGLLTVLILNSEAGLKTYLSGIDIKSLKIRKPVNLITHLNEAVAGGKVRADEFGKAFATTIVNANLSNEEITENMTGEGFGWFWWLILIVLILLFYIIWRTRKKVKTDK